MKKIIIMHTVVLVLLLSLAIVEGLYILKCKTKISHLENLNENLSKELNDKNDSLNTTQEEHPIDIELQKCMEKQNYTTTAMNGCTYLATDKWYKEIDANIVLLKNYMTKEQYNLLMDSQDKWKAYEIAEGKLLNETVGSFVGTMFTTALAGEKYELIKTRAKDLSGLYYYMSDKNIIKH